MMASDYRTYLAANVLNEERIVTYRLLSRALKVHVNVAKEMLYEFHRQQNGKKPRSVHATYLVGGTLQRPAPAISNGSATKDGADESMQSSPYRGSQIPDVDDALDETPIFTITLVREEDLYGLRNKYEVIASIHMYSLAPHPLKDLQTLSDAKREVSEVQMSPNADELARVHGGITNRGVRRRQGRRAPPAAVPGDKVSDKATASQPTQSDGDLIKNAINSRKLATKAPSGSRLSQGSADSGSKVSQDKRHAPVNPPQLKRDSSNIFKSFAKARPKLNREGTDSSAGASGSESAPLGGLEDDTMKGMSEDEEDTFVPPIQTSLDNRVDADRKSRKEREAALRKMMDEDDPGEDREVVSVDVDFQATKEDASTSQPAEEVVQITSGRRRGRRRVIKKKTTKDEEGYLVTREEPVWESFSEDEDVTTKAKLSSFSSNSEKPKKGTGKPEQGSIMSFFGKK